MWTVVSRKEQEREQFGCGGDVLLEPAPLGCSTPDCTAMLEERLLSTPRRERHNSDDTLFSSRLARSPLFPRLEIDLGAVSPLQRERSPLKVARVADQQLTSTTQTGVNMINNYVGMVLLSQAYCYAKCGWLALPLLAVLTGFGAFTGGLIIDSYETLAARCGEAVPSYARIGQQCLGAFGKWLVLISSIFETLMAILCMNVRGGTLGHRPALTLRPPRRPPHPTLPPPLPPSQVIIWSNASLFLPSVPLEYVVGACIVLSFPTNYLRDFSLLSFLSAFGISCILLIMAVVGCGPDPHLPASPFGLT